MMIYAPQVDHVAAAGGGSGGVYAGPDRCDIGQALGGGCLFDFPKPCFIKFGRI